jgi:hypothetical protein
MFAGRQRCPQRVRAHAAKLPGLEVELTGAHPDFVIVPCLAAEPTFWFVSSAAAAGAA